MDLKIPKELLKYTKSNEVKKLIESFKDKTLGITDYYLLSEKIMEQIYASNDGKLMLKFTKDGKPDFLLCDEKNYYNAFLYEAWKNESFEDRVKACKLFINSFFKNTSLEGQVGFELMTNNDERLANVSGSYFFRDKKIYLSPKCLKESLGTTIFSNIFHEATHALQYQDIFENLYQELLGEPLAHDSIFQELRQLEKIIFLPINGYWINPKTKQKERISKETKSKIMSAKNMCETFLPKLVPDDKCASREDLENYLARTMYLYSANERNARINTILMLNSFSKCDFIVPKTEKDKVDIEKKVKFEEKTDKRLQEDKKLLNISLDEACDIFIKYSFYSANYTYLLVANGDNEKEKFANVKKDYDALINSTYSNLRLNKAIKEINEKE